MIRHRGDERGFIRVVIARPPFSVGTRNPGLRRSPGLLDFWTSKSRADFTYLSRTRYPQPLAHSITSARCHLKDRLTRAQHRELVGGNGPSALGPHVLAVVDRDWCAPKQPAPGLLILRQPLPQHQSYCRVLGDLLRQVRVHPREIGETLRRQHARHAGFARAGEQRHNVSSLAAER